MHLILTKNVLGYIVGDFFLNSSGHPVRKLRLPVDLGDPNFGLVTEFLICLYYTQKNELFSR
jgi:hypothetical protein